MYRVEGLRVADSRHSETLQQASSLRSQLEAELNASLYTAAGLVGYVVAHEDFLDPERVATALETIHHNGRHLRNVVLAPDNVLTYVYPVAGNEAAIGLNYERHPEQWRQVERAMTQGHSVLVGPMPLVPGGLWSGQPYPGLPCRRALLGAVERGYRSGQSVWHVSD